jgi:hypothetical protein
MLKLQLMPTQPLYAIALKAMLKASTCQKAAFNISGKLADAHS